MTDVLGRPVANSRVYVLPRRGKPITTTTTKDGRYSVRVGTAGTHGVVIAIGRAHVFRTVLVKRGATNTLDIDAELDTEGGEVIKIEDKKRPQPAVKPKPKGNPRQPLPYSDEAVTRDAWARAWLLLDVDETGSVTRLKMLKRPGFNLEKICIEKAFELKFEPALDGKGLPMKTYVLWTMEWPSWGWLVQGHGTAVHRPNDADEMDVRAKNTRTTAETAGTSNGNPVQDHIREADIARDVVKTGGTWARPPALGLAPPQALARVPCVGSGPLNLDMRNRAYRDCSQPDMTKADVLPWITRETAATAVIEMRAPDLLLVEAPRGSRVPGYVGLGVSGALAIASIAALVKYEQAERWLIDHSWKATVRADEYYAHSDSRDRWGKVALAGAGATLVSIGVTMFIWHRHMSSRSFSVQPTTTSDGAGVRLDLAW